MRTPLKELQLQIDEDSGVGLNDLIVKYINDVKRSIRRWKERQKQKLRDIRDAVKNAWINVGKKASQLTLLAIDSANVVHIIVRYDYWWFPYVIL